jgi:ABC-2 type transport system permease protein
MKIISIIIKSLKEQIRSYWVLLLSLSMGPFFIFLYYLITESSESQYEILVINHDLGVLADGEMINYGEELIGYYAAAKEYITPLPFIVTEVRDRKQSIEEVKNKKADALIIIDSLFSSSIEQEKRKESTSAPAVEFIGDLTNTNYLISAVWANEIINEYVIQKTNSHRVVELKETALGKSASVNEFDMLVPGILILSLIMLMFTASIAMVSEVENKTIIRLKLSKMTAFEYLVGISFTQLLVGISPQEGTPAGLFPLETFILGRQPLH